MESGFRSIQQRNVFGRESGIAHARIVILVDLVVAPIEEEGIVEDGS